MNKLWIRFNDIFDVDQEKLFTKIVSVSCQLWSSSATNHVTFFFFFLRYRVTRLISGSVLSNMFYIRQREKVFTNRITQDVKLDWKIPNNDKYVAYQYVDNELSLVNISASRRNS